MGNLLSLVDILGDDSTKQDDFMDVKVSTLSFANDLPDTTEGGLLEGPSQRTLAGNFTRYDDFGGGSIFTATC